ncbi:MAG: NACHT domain-containing protein [Chloroflexaceae bacterium]|nr:NACHT domain-containing protein [Chloroflexaceae bacterium]
MQEPPKPPIEQQIQDNPGQAIAAGNNVWAFKDTLLQLFQGGEEPFQLVGENLKPQRRKDRKALLNNVRRFWIEGVLENSLHDKILIELALENHPSAVRKPWDTTVQEAEDAEPQPLPEGKRVIDVFEEMGEGGTLLILGEPGSGKTTTLLELTRELVERAEKDTLQPIPLVFNLSSWQQSQSIEQWLMSELRHYRVPEHRRQELMREQQLLLLLDGLDEVSEQERNACVKAINQF